MRIIIVHPSVKLFHYLAGGVLCALSGCTVAPSPTQPSALGMVDARMPAGVDPAFYRAFLQNALEAPQRLEPIRLLRGSIRVAAKAPKEDIEKLAASQEEVARFLEGRPPKRVIVVPGKLVNVVG